jgi:hypothetical protein
MHTVELVGEAIRVAEDLGYRIRQEWLGGLGGGTCEIRGRKSLFVDLAWGPAEQLEHLVETLRREPATAGVAMPRELRDLLAHRKSA